MSGIEEIKVCTLSCASKAEGFDERENCDKVIYSGVSDNDLELAGTAMEIGCETALGESRVPQMDAKSGTYPSESGDGACHVRASVCGANSGAEGSNVESGSYSRTRIDTERTPHSGYIGIDVELGRPVAGKLSKGGCDAYSDMEISIDIDPVSYGSEPPPTMVPITGGSLDIDTDGGDIYASHTFKECRRYALQRHSDNDDKCYICFEELSRIRVKLPCAHRYCSICVLAWLESSRTCPECRLIVKEYAITYRPDRRNREYMRVGHELRRYEMETVVRKRRLKSITEDGSVGHCTICNKIGNSANVIYCSLCTMMNHLECLGYDRAPMGIYFCDRCWNDGEVHRHAGQLFDDVIEKNRWLDLRDFERRTNMRKAARRKKLLKKKTIAHRNKT